jgi:hypothetical protein
MLRTATPDQDKSSPEIRAWDDPWPAARQSRFPLDTLPDDQDHQLYEMATTSRQIRQKTPLMGSWFKATFPLPR